MYRLMVLVRVLRVLHVLVGGGSGDRRAQARAHILLMTTTTSRKMTSLRVLSHCVSRASSAAWSSTSLSAAVAALRPAAPSFS